LVVAQPQGVPDLLLHKVVGLLLTSIQPLAPLLELVLELLELLLVVLPELLLVPEPLEVLLVLPLLVSPEEPPSCPPVEAELDAAPSSAPPVPPLLVVPLKVPVPPPAPLVPLSVPPLVVLPSSWLPEDVLPEGPPSATERSWMPAMISHAAPMKALENPPRINSATRQPFTTDRPIQRRPAVCRCGAGLTVRARSARRSRIPRRRS
jgi:hypothetical protein